MLGGVSSTAETIERAIVFEEVSGVRKVCALQCLSSWPVLFANSLVDVDVGVRVKGLLVFIVLRFREDQFDDALDDQFEAVVEQAGGTSVALSDLSIHERAIFLARLRMCVHRRMGVKPESAHEVLSKILSIIERVTAGVEPERRQTVRYPVKAEATLTIGDRKQETWVDNVSVGGAFVRTDDRPPMQSAMNLEVRLPKGVVKASATVVNVLEHGVGVKFAPDTSLVSSLSAQLENLPLTPPPPVVPVPMRELLTPPPAAQPKPEPPAQAKPVPAPAPPLPDDDVRGERLGNYELLSLLGQGGMGEVHFSRVLSGPRKGEFVALKRLHPRRVKDGEALRLFVTEGKTLALLNHPNIVKTFEAGVFDGHHCLVMEAIDGRDLSQILRRARAQKRQVPIELATRLVKLLLEALDAVHTVKSEAGEPLQLVHGDVAPHNLFVSITGEVKLGDFGVVRHAGTRVADPLAWARPSYLSPEALDGEVEVGADLWAATVTLYELLVGELPFRGETIEQLDRAIRQAKLPPLRKARPDASDRLQDVVARAFSRDPEKRFQSAREFADELAPFFHRERAAKEWPEFVRSSLHTRRGKPERSS
jgi:serine/threonine-protein kinase